MKSDIEIPSRIAALPRDEKGRPIPWFVHQESGQAVDFRVVDGSKLRQAVEDRLCWVCGEKLGTYITFVSGPMCGVNRTSAEPPSHYACARFSASACPFLSTPRMHRREGDYPGEVSAPAGIALERNPGVTLLWTTKEFSILPDGAGGFVLRMGDPTQVQFFCEGRPATREELDYSVQTGLPLLLDVARKDGSEAILSLKRMIRKFYLVVDHFLGEPETLQSFQRTDPVGPLPDGLHFH
jgi:hypothetical protein